MARPYAFGDRAAENSQRLAEYDRLSQGDARTAASTEKASLDERKAAFEQAFKLSEAQRKASEFETKSNQTDALMQMRKEHYDASSAIKDQRLAQFDQQLAIEKAKSELSTQAAAAKADTTLKVLDQATNFLKDARGMDPSSKKFDQQYQDLSAAYPMAFEHPSVKEWVDYHKPLRDKFVAAEVAATKPPGVRDYGTTTTTEDSSGNPKVSTTVPNPPPNTPEATAALLAKHAIAEADVRASASMFSGKPDPQKVGALNAIKAQLGYRLLDSTTGQPVPSPEVQAIIDGAKIVPAVPAAPVAVTPAVTPVAAAPAATAIPMDARYLRDKTTGDVHVVGSDGVSLGILKQPDNGAVAND